MPVYVFCFDCETPSEYRNYTIISSQTWYSIEKIDEYSARAVQFVKVITIVYLYK